MPPALQITHGSSPGQPWAFSYVTTPASLPNNSPRPSSIALSIQALNIPLRTFIHTRALLIALTYVSSSLAPAGSQTSFWGLITIPVKYLPYLFIAMDFLMGGPQAAAVSISGAVVGHLWWWGVWETGALREWGRAPTWLKNFMGEHGGLGGAVNMGGGVTVVPPRRAREEDTTAGRNWGPGRRLGE